MIAELLWEIEEEAAAERGDRQVLGVEKILAQDPCQPLPGKSKKSPAPMLFFSDRPGSRRLVEAAEKGYRLDLRRYLPEGSFPPSMIEAMLGFTSGKPVGRDRSPDRS